MRPVQEPIKVKMTGDTLTTKASSIVDSVAGGALSTSDGKAILDGLAAVGKIRESDELLKRVEILEQKL